MGSSWIGGDGVEIEEMVELELDLGWIALGSMVSGAGGCSGGGGGGPSECGLLLWPWSSSK